MLLTLVVILLLIWVAVVWSIYSSFVTFFSNFSETENYTKAYYASIAALERAELVVKQREPWFVWIGWWTSSINNQWKIEWENQNEYNTKESGSIGNKVETTDWITDSWFSYLSSNNNQWTNLLRTIHSRDTQIPAAWQWNVDSLLLSEDSLDYNFMDYENTENFLLYYDNSLWNPYQKHKCADWWCTKSSISSIEWSIRLPPYIRDQNFWELDDTHSLSKSLQSPKNDAIIDWQIRWKYNNNPFTIYSVQKVSSNNVQAGDTAIREADINAGLNLNFENKRNPISNRSLNNGEVAIISQDQQILESKSYKQIFEDANSSDLQLKLSLLNILQSKNPKLIYPFLEYKLIFWNEISAKYFTINAEWKYDNFQVNTIIYKPTAKESVLWNFTIIF